MKRITKGVLGLFLAAAMMFTSVDTGLLAAQVDGTEEVLVDSAQAEAPEEMETAAPAVEGDIEAESSDENTVSAADDEEEVQLDSTVYGYVQTDGVTYMQEGEKRIPLRGELNTSISESQVAENCLVKADGTKVALVSYQSVYGYGSTSTVNTTFFLYAPIEKGTYFARLKTNGGQTYDYAKLIVVDKPTVAGDAYIDENYDNFGEYLHIHVEGVKLGDGSSLDPKLSLEGKVVATAEETLPVDYDMSDYVYKLKKDKAAADWTKNMSLSLSVSDTADNMVTSPVEWYNDTNWSEPLEHAYYEVNKKVTEFQFKQGLGINAGTSITINLKKYDYTTDDYKPVASGTGKIDANGLLALSLKDSAGKDYIPVQASWVGASDWYEAEIAISGGKTIERSVTIYRYDLSNSGGSNSYFSIITPSQFIYTTETSFEPQFSISADKLSGSGDLTATIEGCTGTLKKNGSYYSGTISLGSGLSEGYHSITVQKGTATVGTATVYVIKPDTFYEDYQSMYWTHKADRVVALTIQSPNLPKKYFDPKGTTGAAAKKIWDTEKLKLEVFAPDGTPLSATILEYEWNYATFYLYLALPEDQNNYYGYYFRVTSDDKTGRYLGSGSGESYYSSQSQGDQFRDDLGKFESLYNDSLSVDNYYSDYNKRDGKRNAIQVSGENVSFPITVAFTKVNETAPVKKTITFTRANMDGNYYFFTSSDIAGLDPKEPYRVTAYDSHLLSTMNTGYVGVYTGKKPSSQTVKVTSVSINEEAPEVVIGKTTPLTFTVTPSNATYKTVTWKSSNTKVATVDADGVVTGVAEGKSKITVTVDGKSASVEVSVVEKKIPLTGLSVNRTELELGINETLGVGINKTPEDATDPIRCVSSDPQIAAVSDDGMVTGIKPGTATITVSSGEFTATSQVTVKAELTALTLNAEDISLATGQHFILEAEPQPVGVDVEISWKPSLPESETGNVDDYISVVPANDNKSARITAKQPGIVHVGVTAKDKKYNVEKGAIATFRITTSDLDQAVSGEDATKIEDALTLAEKDDENKQLWISGLLASYEYDGAPVEPDVAVYYDTTRLRLGKDYSISFKNNKGVGQGELTVSGKGSFSGKLTVNYQIVDEKKSGDTSLKKATITGLEKSYVYTGKAITPEIKVSLAGTDLVKDTDYSLTFSKNTDAGTASLVVAGIGNYKDTVKKTFKITAVDLSTLSDENRDIHVNQDQYYYRAGGCTPDVTVKYTDAEGKSWILKKGSDFKVGYKDNKTVNKNATVTITGQGNFTKKAETTFTVLPAYLYDMTMSVTDLKYKANQKKGTAYQSKVTILDKDGKALKANKDYVLTYQDLTAGIRDLSKATEEDLKKVKEGDLILVKATPGSAGTYREELTGTYYLRDPKDINKATADKIPDQVYNGSAKEPEVVLKGLTKGTDYEILYYINNVEKGNASVVVRGIGAYSGTKILKFKIVASDVKNAYVGAWNGESFVK